MYKGKESCCTNKILIVNVEHCTNACGMKFPHMVWGAAGTCSLLWCFIWH